MIGGLKRAGVGQATVESQMIYSKGLAPAQAGQLREADG